jgi:hypothetical protein
MANGRCLRCLDLSTRKGDAPQHMLVCVWRWSKRLTTPNRWSDGRERGLHGTATCLRTGGLGSATQLVRVWHTPRRPSADGPRPLRTDRRPWRRGRCGRPTPPLEEGGSGHRFLVRLWWRGRTHLGGISHLARFYMSACTSYALHLLLLVSRAAHWPVAKLGGEVSVLHTVHSSCWQREQDTSEVAPRGRAVTRHVRGEGCVFCVASQECLVSI